MQRGRSGHRGSGMVALENPPERRLGRLVEILTVPPLRDPLKQPMLNAQLGQLGELKAFPHWHHGAEGLNVCGVRVAHVIDHGELAGVCVAGRFHDTADGLSPSREAGVLVAPRRPPLAVPVANEGMERGQRVRP